MSHLRLRLAVVVGALLALAGSANAFATGNLVVSQVYGGGDSGASYTHDFIEVFNRGTVSEPLAGFSLQYASATGNFGSTTAQLTELSGSLAPGQYVLVQEAQGAGGTTPLPAPFITDPNPIAMSTTAGKIALVNTTAPLNCGAAATPCSPASLAQIVDLAGYGTTANLFEGSAPTPAPSNTTGVARLAGGCQDTDDNAADFAVVSPPAPRNFTSPALVCDGEAEPTHPTGIGAATPNPVLAGANTLLTVAVAPGANPASTGISVVGDLSQIGGSATQGFFDDGTNGDVLAGNNVFSYGTTVAAATIPGAKSLPVALADAEERNGSTTIALTVSEPPAPPIEISEIQGAAHLSPRNGDTVTTTGVVIGKIGSSFYIFYIQDPTPDANPETSDGLQVFGAAAGVSVRGMVSEFRSGLTSLTLTQLTSPVVTVLSSGNPLPAPTVIGTGGRIPPSTVVEDDATGNVEAAGVLFDPAEDGLDFYESLEGMLVQMNDLVATSSPSRTSARSSSSATTARTRRR